MKTISFYSYKGGTGRSLLAAETAAVLAYIGKTVCVLDFDFEAPGMHHKLSHLVPPSKRHDFLSDIGVGFMDYAFDYIERIENSLRHPEHRPPTGDDAQQSNLEFARGKAMHILQGLQLVGYRKKITVGKKGGTVLFLPAGRLSSDGDDMAYWEYLSDPRWHRFINLDNLGTWFFASLKESVLRLNPTPDYLIVDSRSGVTELAGISTRLLPNDKEGDMLIFLTTTSEESIEGTRLLLQSYVNARNDTEETRAPRPENIHLVVSRLPEYFLDRRFDESKVSDAKGPLSYRTDEELSNQAREIAARILPELKHVHFIRSEPMLQGEERLPLSFYEKTLNSPMTHDFVRLIAEMAGMTETDLNDNLGEYRPQGKSYRPYFLQAGLMINPQDKSYNVAFRVDTYLKTLDSMYDRILKRELEHHESSENAYRQAGSALFDAGRTAAEDFGIYLSGRWKKGGDHSKLTIAQRLNEWCEFDSTVGFGQFTSEIDKREQRGTIRLQNSFLAHNRRPDENSLCPFMRGYITRVLTAIFQTDEHVVVQHESSSCSQFTDSLKGTCVFPFQLEEEKKGS